MILIIELHCSVFHAEGSRGTGDTKIYLGGPQNPTVQLEGLGTQ